MPRSPRRSATAKCRETVAWARELLGGNGIVADYNVARFFADAEALYSYEGTYQIQNLIVGKAITGWRLCVTRAAANMMDAPVTENPASAATLRLANVLYEKK